MGVAACLVSGVFEGLGALVGERLRRITPRAALLSTLAGIAIAFIALNHVFPLWEKPLIAFVPLAFILIEYFSRAKLPLRIPAGLYALVFGGAIAWGTGAMDGGALARSLEGVAVYIPSPAVAELVQGFGDILPYLGIAIPMGILSFFGTLQNIESAAAAGDEFPATPALAMNGIGTMVGALFGSPFPTTVYIGHPGWKALGARSGYSVINGAVMTVICMTGLIGVIASLVPLEADILSCCGSASSSRRRPSSPRRGSTRRPWRSGSFPRPPPGGFLSCASTSTQVVLVPPERSTRSSPRPCRTSGASSPSPKGLFFPRCFSPRWECI